MLITKQKSDLEMKNVINVKNINVFFFDSYVKKYRCYIIFSYLIN